MKKAEPFPGLFPNTCYDLVVVVASAGGLSTLIRLLQSIPASFPAAIVFAQHLLPNRPSMLPEILRRKSMLDVKQAADQDQARPGVLYVAPPGHHLVVQPGGVLALNDDPPRQFVRPSADVLLESAACTLGARVIAVVLSGMGSDGTLGVQAVKHAGGIVIVEEPSTAQFTGMPDSAIHGGNVDLILPVEEIGPQILRMIHNEDSL